MNNNYKALLFDLNGTVIDDMHYHNKAWYSVLTEDLEADLTWEEVKKEMYGKNREVLNRIFGEDRFSDEEAEKLSVEKEKRYQTEYKPHLKLINGLGDFLKLASENNMKTAIASAAITDNIDFVLDNLDIRTYFDAIVSADDVHRSKPDPETFLEAAKKLQMDPSVCVVLEDAPKGVEAAENAGMKCIVILTAHPKEDFSKYKNVIAFIEDYTDPFIKDFFNAQV